MPSVRISLRLNNEDAKRYLTVWNRILRRTEDQAKKTNYLLELMGLRPLRLIRPNEREFLSSRIDDLPELDDGSAAVPKPRIRFTK
jgi:hypothetical protein